MFPGIYEFHWDLGHVIFLGAFFSVLVALSITLAVVAARARRDRRMENEDHIRWHEEFESLPASRRRCRHEIAGDGGARVCDNGFDCGRCPHHTRLQELHAAAVSTIESANSEGAPPDDVPVAVDQLYGLSLPPDRLYDRGHTWVRAIEGGDVEIGLDDLAQRLFGAPDVVALPTPGSRIHVHGRGWDMRRGGRRVRILAPLDGTVVEAGGLDRGWLLRLRPDKPLESQAHLLRGQEVRPWIEQEVQLLSNRLATPTLGPTLADGGQLIDDLPRALPEVEWDSIWDDFFLEG